MKRSNASGNVRGRGVVGVFQKIWIGALAVGWVAAAQPSHARLSSSGHFECNRALLSDESSGSLKLEYEVKQRSIDSIESLKIMTYNVENLFLHVGKYEYESDGELVKKGKARAKPEDKVLGVAYVISKEDPDIVVVQEVESLDVLEVFAKKYLAGRYRAVLTVGNDPRGIQIGFLVKKDLPLDVEIESHKHEKWVNPLKSAQGKVALFSRDLPALLFRSKNRSPRGPPLFAILGTHYKSKRPPKNASRSPDPQSNGVRKAQVERTSKIITRYQERYGEDFPILLAGDFNGSLHEEPEFESLRKDADLLDVLDLIQPPLKGGSRVTHSFHPGHGKAAVYQQLDAILITRVLAKYVKQAFVHPYVDYETGKPKPLPRTKKERDEQPSDHRAVSTVLDFKPIRDRIATQNQ